MKKILTLALMGAVSTAMLSGCKKDEFGHFPLSDNTVTVKVENGESYDSDFSTVKVILDTWEYEDGDWRSTSEYEAASGSWKNGGFSLILPETVDSNSLLPISLILDTRSGAIISNSSAKAIQIEFTGYSNDDVPIARFYCKHDSKRTSATLIYVDRDVAVTGEDAYAQYNIELKKGWQMIYFASAPSGYKSKQYTEPDYAKDSVIFNFKWTRYDI
jgi:hypothetical protein